MSDSFADLWSSSAPLPPKRKPQTLASASPSTTFANKPQKSTSSSKSDLFSLLASSGSNQQRYGSPNSAVGRTERRSNTGTPSPAPPVSSVSSSSRAGGDAFRDLFSSSSASGGGSPASMTIAARMARERSSAGASLLPPKTDVACDSAWAKLDSLAIAGGFGSDSPDMDFDFGSREDVPPEPHTKGGLVDFDGDIVDDDFGPRRGPRERLLDGFSVDSAADGIGGMRDEDDILGILSKPVEVVKAQVQTQSSPSTVSREASPAYLGNRKTRYTVKSSSPPPHIIGQIVEMGFDVDQARNALAKTKDGVDVQAALELLLSRSAFPDNRNGHSRSRVAEQEDLMPARSRGTPKGFKEREWERTERIRRERERESSTPASTDVVSDMQDHADRLISQASEIGISVLSKASAFWKEGKDRVAKVYEERATGVVQKERSDGKPKWMMDGPALRDEGDEQESWKENLKGKQKVQQEFDELQENYVEQRPDVSLFGDEPIESLRARPPRQRPAASRTSTPPSRPIASPPTTRERPLPKASACILTTVNKHRTAGTSQFKLGQYASAIESYSAAISGLPQGHLLLVPLLNNRALARMRIGEYKGASGDAGRALKVVLIVDDGAGGAGGFDPTANSSVQITLSSWNPSVEPSFILIAAQQKENEGGWAHPQGLGVDLLDGYVKALRRRAEASEGGERWADALKDWEVLSVSDAGWVKEQVRKEAQRGAARCRKMMNEGSGPGEMVSKPKPKPPITGPKPIQAVPVLPSTALRSLQATTAQAEADENLKFQLKDTVDAKLLAWRTGKETNIRALLASLDLVLWEDILKGVKVGGLHELVTPIQVKKGYMKAIGRVHPDKLNAQNSTVEQRMLANGVFGTLNEAWIAFQSS